MTVKTGFIGAGVVGQLAHLHSFSRLEDCELVALAEARPKLAREVAAHFGILKTYTNHKELLKDSGVKAVVLSQPFHRNHSLGMDVLRAGKHLLTERPAASTAKEAEELAKTAEKKRLIYMVGYNRRHDPGVLAARTLLRECLDSGDLGALQMVDLRCFVGDWMQNPGNPILTPEPPPPDPAPPRYPAFVKKELQRAYDHFLDFYSQSINLLRFLLPQAEPKAVNALRHQHCYLVGLTIGDAPVSLRGAAGQCQRGDEGATFHFEHGRIRLDLPPALSRQQVAAVSLYRRARGGWSEERVDAPVEWAFLRQARAFLQAVLRGKEAPSSGRACVGDLEVIEEIFRVLAKSA